MGKFLTVGVLWCIVFSNGFADENTVYCIRNVAYDIQGKTKPFALLVAAGITAGEEITGDERLTVYIKEKEQALLNNRQIESAVVAYVVAGADETGRFPVDLLLKTADTNNFVILPYPKFSSSSGTKLELRLRDFNFLGSLSEFGINLGYARDVDGNNYANAVLKFDLPFQYGGLVWNLGFDNEFSYRIDNSSEPFYFNNISSLSVDLPFRRTTLTLGFKQNLTLEKEELFDYDNTKSPFTYLVSGKAHVIDFHHNLESYFTSEPFAAWKMPLGIQVFSFGEWAYEPAAGVAFRYWPFDDREQYRGPIGIFSHSIGFSRINWHGNFQSGFLFNAEQNNHFYFDGFGHKEENRHDVSVTGIGHIPLADFCGVSFRVRYQHSLFTETRYLAAGGPLRGIPDKSLTEPERNLSATGLAFVNLDMPFRIGWFRPSQWGTGKRLTVFDLEFHLSPFFDAALLKNGHREKDYEWLFTGGLELKIFPLAFRSFFIRVSTGFDLRNSDNSELFIGLGNHY